jgi:nicotinamidase-related amidase
MDISNSLLLIVDVQNGFVVNKATEQIISPINELVGKWKARKLPIVYSRFINEPGSPWVRFMGFKDLMSQEETKLHDQLINDSGAVYDKTAYSAWSAETEQACKADKCDSVFLCGIDTDQCVLATAIDIFDSGLRPILVTDCCASSAGDKFHEAGLLLLKRLVGQDQMITSKEINERN